MKKKATHSVLKHIPPVKDAALRKELARAHLLVALLAFALLLTLGATLMPSYAADVSLSITAMILLGIVGLFSLSIAVMLYVRHR